MDKLTKLLSGMLVLCVLVLLSTSARALTIIQNTALSVSAIVGSLPVLDPGNSTGGSSVPSPSGARFSGLAYPGASVTLMKDGAATTVTADAKGYFAITLPDEQGRLFTLYAVDKTGLRSTLLNFPTVMHTGYLTDISSIRFAPTLTSDKLSIVPGQYVRMSGSGVPGSSVVITIHGAETQTYTLEVSQEGVYSISVPVSLSRGDYTITASYAGDTAISKTITLMIGTSTLTRLENTRNIPGDCNVDQRITLLDFSVLAYWFRRPHPPSCVDTNHDGVLTLVDFSIMAFYWN